MSNPTNTKNYLPSAKKGRWDSDSDEEEKSKKKERKRDKEKSDKKSQKSVSKSKEPKDEPLLMGNEESKQVVNEYRPARKTLPDRRCRSIECYQQLNYIDEGTYGLVFRAKCKQTGEIYAVKQVKPGPLAGKLGFPTVALREINALLTLKHANIIPVREMVVGSGSDKIYMVMEYCENDVKTVMKLNQQSFSTAEIKRLMLQLLSAISYVHQRGYLHRDLKTSNLLYSNSGKLYVCDFGLARKYET
jgi:cell division cycle 2-like protein